MQIRPLVRVLALLGLAACSGLSATTIAPASLATVIGSGELRGTGASNVYDAISQLRPAFFATRGATSLINEPPNPILVVVNQSILGGVEELRDIDPKGVRSIRRLTAAEVFQLTGRSAPSGGIEVTFGP